MAYFFTIFIVDRESNKKFEILKDRIKKEFPHDGIDATFGCSIAMIRLKEISRQKAVPPDIAVFVLEIDQDDGDVAELIGFIKKSKRISHIPVILFTDSKDDKLMEGCIAAGAEKAFRRDDADGLVAFLAHYKKTGNWRSPA